MPPTAPDGVLFNPFLPEVRADPYPLYRRLREHNPVHESPVGVTVFARYADAEAILANRRFSVDHRHAEGVLNLAAVHRDPELLDRRSVVMLFADPPDHTRLRSLVNKAFTARRIEALRPRIQHVVDELLDEVEERGEADLVDDVAYPLPVTVICEMLGVPASDHETFKGWSAALAANLDPLVSPERLERAMAAGDAFDVYFRDRIAERRASPRDDLLSALIAAEEQGSRLNEDELLGTLVLLLVAGHETTVKLISNGTYALLRHPDELRRLRDDPSLDASAIEELLRYDSPVQMTARTALEDIDVNGVGIPRHRQVLVLLGAANRDPAVFADPDRLELSRTDNRHMAFGGGIHFCLGSALARLEGRIAIGALVRRFPRMELAGDPEWREQITLRGLSRLPVRV
jgi:cytochrome P450